MKTRQLRSWVLPTYSSAPSPENPQGFLLPECTLIPKKQFHSRKQRSPVQAKRRVCSVTTLCTPSCSTRPTPVHPQRATQAPLEFAAGTPHLTGSSVSGGCQECWAQKEGRRVARPQVGPGGKTADDRLTTSATGVGRSGGVFLLFSWATGATKLLTPWVYLKPASPFPALSPLGSRHPCRIQTAE